MGPSHCSNSTFYLVNSGVYVVTRVVLLLPLCVFVLFLGQQRWRRRRRRPSAPASHSDVFMIHVAAVELVWSVALVFVYCGLLCWLPLLALVGTYLLYMVFYGQVLLHVLSCAERYLAAVHPVTYLGQRGARGERLRTAAIGCVYALSLALSHATLQTDRDTPVASLLFLVVLALAAVSFFSLSVLRVLIRPGPGDVGGARERVAADPSKRRALHAIVAVMVALWLWFLALLVPSVLYGLQQVDVGVACAVESSATWLALPSGLVLHLLYLHHARKLPCCSTRG